MSTAVALTKQDYRLVLYVPPRDRFDGARELEIDSAVREIKACGGQPKIAVVVNPKRFDALVGSGVPVDAILKRAHRLVLREYSEIWMLGGGVCAFAREIVRLAYYSKPFVPVIDRTPPDSLMWQLLDVYRDYENTLLWDSGNDNIIWTGQYSE